ncbi:MAG TPA: hypothetical protein VFL64_19720, partial [Rhizobacter sp.]|nr:hypothetical protein [Rhizobacter sp.]
MNHRPTPPRCGHAWQRLILLACGWLALTPAFAASPDYAIAPAPAWVQPVAPSEPTAAPTEQLSHGVHY